MKFENNNDNKSNSQTIVVSQPAAAIDVVNNDIDNSQSKNEINSFMIPEIIKQETTTITTTTTIKKKKRKSKRKRSSNEAEKDNNNTNDLSELCDISFTSVYSTTSSISSISNDFYSTSVLSNTSLEEVPQNYNYFNNTSQNYKYLNDSQNDSTLDTSETKINNKKGKEKEIDIVNVKDNSIANIEKLKQKQKHLSFTDDASLNHSFTNHSITSSVNIISKKINNKSQISESKRLSIPSSINIPILNDILNIPNSSIKLSNSNNLDKDNNETDISEDNSKYKEKSVKPYNRYSLGEGNYIFNNFNDYNSHKLLKDNQLTLKTDSNSIYSFTQSSKSIIQKEGPKNDIKIQTPYFINNISNKNLNNFYSLMDLNSKISQSNLRVLNNNKIKNLILNNVSIEDTDNSKNTSEFVEEKSEKSPDYGFIQRVGYSRPEGLEPWIEKNNFNLEKDKCSICFEDFKAEANIPFMLVCQHYFHFECIFKWCCQEDNSKCPLCRKPIDKNCIFEDIVFEFDNMDEKDLCYSTILPEIEHEISTLSTTTLTHSETTTSTTSSRYPPKVHSDLSYASPINVITTSSSSIHSPFFSSSKSSYHVIDDRTANPAKEEIFSRSGKMKYNNRIATPPPTTFSIHSIPNELANTSLNNNTTNHSFNPSYINNNSSNNNNSSTINPTSPESKYSLSGISLTNYHDRINNSIHHSSPLNRHSFISLQNYSSQEKLDTPRIYKSKKNPTKTTLNIVMTSESLDNTESTSSQNDTATDQIKDSLETTDITLYNASHTESTSNNSYIGTTNDNNTINAFSTPNNNNSNNKNNNNNNIILTIDESTKPTNNIDKSNHNNISNSNNNSNKNN